MDQDSPVSLLVLLLPLLVVVIPIVAAVVLSVRARRRRDRVEELLTALASTPPDPSARPELWSILQTPKVAEAPKDFLERVLPHLSVLLNRPEDVGLVEWFFIKFGPAFPAQRVLARWLGEALREALLRPDATNAIGNIIERARRGFSPMDAASFYQTALSAVHASSGTPHTKELALRLGRISYASVRADRRPTIYDEQAVANDIAVRCPSSGVAAS